MIITGRAPGEQLCWSEPWMRFSARTGFLHVAKRHASVETGSERFTNPVEWVTSNNAPLGGPVPLVWFWRCRDCIILSCDTTELDATPWQPLQHGDVTTRLTCCFALTVPLRALASRLPFPYGAVITLSGE